MTKFNIPGPRSKELVERENQHMAPGLQSVALFSGLAAARGEGCKVIDEDGNEYLDFIAGVGVGSIGHSHPHYTASLKASSTRSASEVSPPKRAPGFWSCSLR